MLRLLHTCFSRSWGGLEIHSVIEAELMMKRGHKITLGCCEGSRVAAAAGERGVPTLTLRVSGYFSPGALIRMKGFLQEESPDVIHCQQSKDLAFVTPALRLARRAVPVVLSKRVGSYIRKKTPLHRFTYAPVRRVLAISEVIRRNVIDTTPVPADRVVTVHHGIDTTWFDPARGEGKRVRRELGLVPEHRVVGFVGRFSRGKGHEEFLEAARVLRPDYPQVRFVIVGEASRGEERYAADIKALCTRLGLDDVVTFTGFRRDVRDVMDAFDIFAFPSHAEAFGSVLIEAMAMEKPVVSSNSDGTLDIVIDEENGLFFTTGDSGALAAAVRRLLDDPALGSRLGSGARKRVMECFDQSMMIDTIERIYGEVSGGTDQSLSRRG